MDQVRFEVKCTPIYLTACFTVDEGERELGGSVFGIKEAFRTLSLVDEKSVVSIQGYKAMKVFIQALLISTIFVRIAKHEIISIL